MNTRSPAECSGRRGEGVALAGAQLRKSLQSRHVTMITIGGIIGAGLFVGSSAAIAAIGPAAILAYVLAGLVVMMVMRMLSEMAAAAPGLGSFTEYIRLGLGNWAGFVSGWLYWYNWLIVLAIEAVAGAHLLQQWIASPVWVLMLLLLLMFTTVNLLSSRAFGEFEFWFASIKVAAIIAFILIAGAYALGLTSPSGPTFTNLVAHGGFAPFGWLAVLAGTTTVFFSMVGAETATIAAAESSESNRVISRMTTTIIIRILLFYVLSVLLIVAVVPWTAIHPGDSPFAQALTRTHVPAAGTIMNAIVLTAVLSCLNAGMFVSSRVLFVLAARGDAPQWIVALNARQVPARAIVLGSSVGFLAVLISIFSPDRLFAFLVNASGAIMIVVYLLTCFAHLRLRRQLERSDPPRLTLRVPWFPWLSWATVLAMAGVLVAMAINAELSSQLFSSLFACVVAGGAWWFRERRRQQRRDEPRPVTGE